MPASSEPRPLLWQLTISHFSEKARWALDHKQVPHRRRAAPPGVHTLCARWLTRGAAGTFPVLELDGERIADSTAVIAALERSHPERPLYPEDPEQRRRALALEDYFDEELGPAARLLPFHELMQEPELFGELAARSAPPALARAKPALSLFGRVYTNARFGAADPAAAGRARGQIIGVLERIEAELEAGDGVHLVGERFSVADLAGAALFFPVVVPEGGPLPPDMPQPPDFDRFREEIAGRPGYVWVEETYRRYRQPGAAA